MKVGGNIALNITSRLCTRPKASPPAPYWAHQHILHHSALHKDITFLHLFLSTYILVPFLSQFCTISISIYFSTWPRYIWGPISRSGYGDERLLRLFFMILWLKKIPKDTIIICIYSVIGAIRCFWRLKKRPSYPYLGGGEGFHILFMLIKKSLEILKLRKVLCRIEERS